MRKRDQIKLREKDQKKSHMRKDEKALFYKDDEFLSNTINELSTDDQIINNCSVENLINNEILICHTTCKLRQLGTCSLLNSNKYDVIDGE